jgi:anti-sigma B factor antagonist
MTTFSKIDNENLILSVEGRIDSTTAPELEETVKNGISQCAGIIFDFEKLDYISSAGLRILLGVRKLMGNDGMKIINVNDTVNEIFEVTGFSLILNYERL